jgi:hypothetical protein
MLGKSMGGADINWLVARDKGGLVAAMVEASVF